jgi:uncharacterized membrane protein
MHNSKRSIVSQVAILAAFAMTGQVAVAADAPMSKEVQSMVDFQCHGATTLKQAEANYANLARGYTDQHPAMACLKQKIQTLKAAGK